MGFSKIVVGKIPKVLEGNEWESPVHRKSMPTEFGDNSPWKYQLIIPQNGLSTGRFKETKGNIAPKLKQNLPFLKTGKLY